MPFSSQKHHRQDFLFLGGHLAIDFANTVVPPPGLNVEFLQTWSDVIDWLEQAKLSTTSALRLPGSRMRTFTVPYFGVALRMVAGSHLIATLPRSMSELLVDRRTIRLIEPPKEVEPFRYIMVWHRRQEMDPRNIWLRQTMREITSELLSAIRRSETSALKNAR